MTKQYLQALHQANQAPWNQEAMRLARQRKVPLLETSLHSLTFLLEVLDQLQLEAKTKEAVRERGHLLMGHLSPRTLDRVNNLLGELTPAQSQPALEWATTLALGLAPP